MASHGITQRVASAGMCCTPFCEHWDKGLDDLALVVSGRDHGAQRFRTVAGEPRAFQAGDGARKAFGSGELQRVDERDERLRRQGREHVKRRRSLVFDGDKPRVVSRLNLSGLPEGVFYYQCDENCATSSIYWGNSK